MTGTTTTAPLYMPYKTVGLVCDKAPYFVNRLGSETFLTVPIGNCFQVFKVDRLAAVLVSKPAPGPISCLQAKNQDTFVSVGKDILHYRRTRMIGKLGEHEGEVLGLMIVGDVLLSYDSLNHIKVFNCKDGEELSTMTLLHKAKITSIVHPATYVNKFVFGFEDGHMELWNVRTCKLIYSFKSHSNYLAKFNSDLTNKSASITCLVQSPSCDILGVGFSSGDIMIMNVKMDQVLFHFKQKHSVTSLTFRSDALTEKYPYLVSASDKGHIYTWSVRSSINSIESANTSKLANIINFAHDGCIVKAEFLHGEPILITSGYDNCINVWIYDNQDGSARILRSRQGHVKYPTQIKYYGDVSSSTQYGSTVGTPMSGIISSDAHGAVMFSKVEKHCHFDIFSQSAITNTNDFHGSKLPETIDFDFAFINARSWGNMVSVHRGHDQAYVWKVEDKAITKTVLKIPDELKKKGVPCTSVVVSPCGHYAVIGYKDGSIHRYNIQSAVHRGSYPKGADKNVFNLEQPRDVSNHFRHTSEITGLFIDSSNSVLVSISNDGYVVFWDFNQLLPLHTEFLKVGLLKISGIKDAGLVAIADEKQTIRVYDLTTFKLCRVFIGGHELSITSMIFGLDGRRLLSASSDATLRVWDLTTGRCLAWLKFDAPITSVTFSQYGDLLVAKKGIRGVDVCIDRSLSELMNFSFEPSSPLSVNIAQSSATKIDNSELEEEVENESVDLFSKCRSDSVGIVMSDLPRAYWSSICHMELLRKRNIVAKPVTKISIPFFLPSLENSGRKAPFPGDEKNSTEKDVSNKSASSTFIPVTKESRIIKRETNSSSNINRILFSSGFNVAVDGMRFLDYLVKLSPPQVDMEIRSVCLHDRDVHGLKTLSMILMSLSYSLKSGKNFEILQAYVNRTLTLHSSKIMVSYKLKEVIEHLHQTMQDNNHNMQTLIHMAICLVKTSLNMQIM